MKKKTANSFSIRCLFLSFLYFFFIKTFLILWSKKNCKCSHPTNKISRNHQRFFFELSSGFSLREIRFYQPNTEKEFSLQRVDLDINLLSLLTGSLAADVQIKSKEGSNLDLSFVSNGFSPAAAESPLSQLSSNAQDFDFLS